MQPIPQNTLAGFEVERIPEHYREYFSHKRHNFYGSTDAFPPIWKLFELLDQTFDREFDDFERVTTIEQLLPSMIFRAAHSKVRIAIELGFSTAEAEAFSIMRDAIEAAGFARYLHRLPDLQKVWGAKYDGEAEERRFRKLFIDFRAKQLFDGVPVLHEYWKAFSDLGSHMTPNSIVHQLVTEEKDLDGFKGWKFNYTGPREERGLAVSLCRLLDAGLLIEKTHYDEFETRFRFDEKLLKIRGRLVRQNQIAHEAVSKKYNVNFSGGVAP